jgi:hypothetical protein
VTDLHPVQQKWLEEHPRHQRWHPLPFVGLERWTDEVWVMPDGQEVTEAPRWMTWGGLQVASAGDTLYVNPTVLRAARKFYVV